MFNKPYILCAAIWFKDNKKYEHQPKNIESGKVVCGRRHHNCFITVFSFLGEKFKCEHVQGFLTSDDRFVTRQEAAEIAFISGQISEKKNGLISEDLY
jgi:hypothetical protein